MINVTITGANGKMGHVISSIIAERDDCTVISGIDLNTADNGKFPIVSEPALLPQKPDVIIDFSHPNNLDDILSYALTNKTKLVIATTGYNDEQLTKIKEAAKQIPIFQSYNTSYGVQMVTKILRQVAKEFYQAGYDIEILEKHHNQKIDAPSGTAKLLYEVMEEEIGETTAVTDRSSLHEKRKHEQIGIQAMRGGTIFGEHTVMFAGIDEIIEIKHTALSKEVFVQGAISAAYALIDKDNGLYTLKSLY